MSRSPRLAYSSKILDLSFQLPSSITAEEEMMANTNFKSKEEEEDEEEEEQDATSDVVTNYSVLPIERVTKPNATHELGKSRMRSSTSFGRRGLGGKTEVFSKNSESEENPWTIRKMIYLIINR